MLQNTSPQQTEVCVKTRKVLLFRLDVPSLKKHTPEHGVGDRTELCSNPLGDNMTNNVVQFTEMEV